MPRSSILLLGLVVLALGCSKPKTVAATIATAPVSHATEDEVAPTPPPFEQVEVRQMQTPDWVSTVAVTAPHINIVNGDRYDVNLSQTIVEKIEAALLGTGRFQVAERSRLDSVKKEINTNNDADWFNASSATKLGRFAGAKYVVLPSVSANVGIFNTTFELQVKILETETGTMVHDYTVRSSSSSMDTNASIRTCIGSLQPKLAQAFAYDFPARGVVVKIIGKKRDTLWIDTRQAAFIRPGMTLRILTMDEVYNPMTKTKGNFFASVGSATVMSVESAGIVARVKNTLTPVEQGMIVEVKP